MLKAGAVLNMILAVSESILSVKWFFRAREEKNPRYAFFGAVWLLNTLMQCILACDLWEAGKEESAEDDWDDFEDYED